jgi:hypothetical protein
MNKKIKPGDRVRVLGGVHAGYRFTVTTITEHGELLGHAVHPDIRVYAPDVEPAPSEPQAVPIIPMAHADPIDTGPHWQCDFRFAHDPVTDRPMGARCANAATHQIEWEDGRRWSLACSDHLDIEPEATVKPSAIVPLTKETK